MPVIVKSRHLAYAVPCVVLLAVSGKLVFDRKTETPTQRAYRECRPCGLSESEIDQRINDYRHSTLTREELIKLFEATFADDEDGHFGCMPCVEAVLDAAEEAR